MSRAARDKLVIYGASGYTGRLLAAQAGGRGLDVVLAGRDGAKLAPLSQQFGFPSRVAAVDDRDALISALVGAGVVVNCAGPFDATARPVCEACLSVGAHYLDVGGESRVFAALYDYREAAARAGVMILPGAGFVMAASDALAAHVVSRLPNVRHLWLAVSREASISRGSFASMLELPDGFAPIRRRGKLVAVPAGSLTRRFDFGQGAREAVIIPWPDPFSAFLTTGVPNIEVYLEADPFSRLVLRASALFAPALRLTPARKTLEALTPLWPDGPSEAEREASPKVLVAEAEDVYRRRVAARLFTPNVYTFTGDCVIALVERILAGDARAGYGTPAGVYGADFVLGLPGVRREEAGAPRLA